MKKAILLLAIIWLLSWGLHMYRSWVVNIDEDTISHDEFVDLELPSGTLWSSKNVGANLPEEYGNLYAWGESEVKENYYQVNYQFYSGEILPQSPNYYDEKTIKVVEIGTNIQGTKYDVSTIIQGSKCCMPTEENIVELKNECSWREGKLNGIGGYKITGKNGNSIFMAFSYYWSSNINLKDNLQAIALKIDKDVVDTVHVGRRCGLSVRAILNRH